MYNLHVSIQHDTEDLSTEKAEASSDTRISLSLTHKFRPSRYPPAPARRPPASLGVKDRVLARHATGEDWIPNRPFVGEALFYDALPAGEIIEGTGICNRRF